MLMLSGRLFRHPVPSEGEYAPYQLNLSTIEYSESVNVVLGDLTDVAYNPASTSDRCIWLLENVYTSIPWHDRGEIQPNLNTYESTVGTSWKYTTSYNIYKGNFAPGGSTPEDVISYYLNDVVGGTRHIGLYDYFGVTSTTGYTYGIVTDSGYFCSNDSVWDPDGKKIVSVMQGIIFNNFIRFNDDDTISAIQRGGASSILTNGPYGYYYYVRATEFESITYREIRATSGGSVIYTQTQSRENYYKFLIENGVRVTEDEIASLSDPYAQAGQSGTGGGSGDVDNTSEPVDIPDLPTISATDTGLVSLFAPTALQLKSLANYLWSGAFDLDSFRKIFADPMDCILGLSILPVAINTQTQRVLSVGNISTGISMDFVESQYVEIDCGSLNVNEYFGAYLDYSPYTKAEIYLPYIGIRPLAIDDIMNKTVKVVYHIDLLSGTCTAFIKADQSVIYSYIGQCSIEIPVTSVNYGNMITGALSIAGSIGSMVATGGMSAPMALGNIAATATNSLKPEVEKSGAYSGGGGLLGVQFPYLIVTRPRAAIPANQNKYIGYPGFMTKTVGNLSGYTEFEEIHLENIPATNEELAEIERLMKEGVLL